jgi:hypothetical protein
MLPATGFSPGATSVLPDERIVPQQIDKEKFLKSLQPIPIRKNPVEIADKQKSN